MDDEVIHHIRVMLQAPSPKPWFRPLWAIVLHNSFPIVRVKLEEVRFKFHLLSPLLFGISCSSPVAQEISIRAYLKIFPTLRGGFVDFLGYSFFEVILAAACSGVVPL